MPKLSLGKTRTVPKSGVMDTEPNAVETGSVETTVAVKNNKDRGADFKTVKQSQAPVAATSLGAARARSGLAVTLSFDFQSVRVESSVEIPCGSTDEEIKAAQARGYQLASEAMKPEIQDAKEFLSGGKAEIFGR